MNHKKQPIQNIRKVATLIGLAITSQAAFATQQIHLYAASSMTNTMDELAKNYEEKHDVKIIPVYGGSSTLARQIEQGAPADIFISANTKWMEYLQSKDKIIDTSVTNLVANDLVLIAPKDADKVAAGKSDEIRIQTSLKSLGNERLAVGMTDSVPAGIYAKQALETMNLWNEVSGKLASTSNVRIALSLVERAEAPYGIVYYSDAVLSQKVRVAATFSAQSHDPIVYPMAQITDDEGVEGFYTYLQSKEAKQLYDKYGFRPYLIQPQNVENNENKADDETARDAVDAALVAPAIQAKAQQAVDAN